MPSITLPSLATVSAVAGVGGAGIGALGAISSGNAAAAEATYGAQVASNNQVIANQNAAYATQAGNQEATTAGLRARAAAGALASGIAANGLDVNSGSPADLREGEAEKGQLDTETTRQAAALRAYGYRTQSTNFGAESTLDTAAAGFDQTAGLLKAGGGLLGAANALPAKWLNFGGGADTGGDYSG